MNFITKIVALHICYTYFSSIIYHLSVKIRNKKRFIAIFFALRQIYLSKQVQGKSKHCVSDFLIAKDLIPHTNKDVSLWKDFSWRTNELYCQLNGEFWAWWYLMILNSISWFLLLFDGSQSFLMVLNVIW